MILGLGRAIGEAIAVDAGDRRRRRSSARTSSTPGDTLASEDRRVVPGRVDARSSVSSLIYLALILLVFSLVVNLLAQLIVRRVARDATGWRR